MFEQPSDRRPLQPSDPVRHPPRSVAIGLAGDNLQIWPVWETNINERKIIGIGSGKVKVFPVELELGSLSGNETLGGLCCRSRADKAGRCNHQQVQEGGS